MVEIGLKELEARIREDGKKEVKRIEAETKKEIDEIKKNIQIRADACVDKVRRDGELEIEMVRRRIIAEANTKAKELINLERNKLIDRVFEEAENRILRLDDKEKRKILENLVDEGKKSIRDPIILVDERYHSLLEGAQPSKLNDFGVIVMSKDKKVRIDNTLRGRLQQLKIRLKPKVASILFAENGTTVFDR